MVARGARCGFFLTRMERNRRPGRSNAFDLHYNHIPAFASRDQPASIQFDAELSTWHAKVDDKVAFIIGMAV